MTVSCPPEIELHRQYPDASPALREHVATCDACARQWSEIEALSALAREAPRPSRSAVQLHEARARFVASALDRGRRRAPALFATGAVVAVAAAAALVMLLRRPGSVDPAASRATIAASPDAHVTWRSRLPDEVVVLADGNITVEVAPLAKGERFRVVTDDAEVEVRGTKFDVLSSHGHLVAVHVWHGRVEVRPRGTPTVVLHPDEEWKTRPAEAVITAASHDPDPAPSPPVADVPELPPPPDLPPPHPARPSAPVRTTAHDHREPSPAVVRVQAAGGSAAHDHDDVPVSAPAVSGPAPSPVAPPEAPARPATAKPEPAKQTAHSLPPAELAFRRAWEHLRANRPEDAAAEFHRVPPDDPLAEDAMFWQGASLARAHHPADATRVLTAFVARFPSSARVAEATALLGWQALALGNLDLAETRFRSLSGPLPEELKQNVEAGLAELHRRRTR
jgi:hypothetical protein